MTLIIRFPSILCACCFSIEQLAEPDPISAEPHPFSFMRESSAKDMLVAAAEQDLKTAS